MTEEDLKKEPKKKKAVKLPKAPEKTEEKAISKQVVPEEQITSDKPIFVEVPVDQSCVVSDTAQFACKIVGDPQPEIQWYKGKWGKLSSFGRIKVEYDKGTGISTLKITKLDKPDKGMYRAVAKNNKGEAVTTFELKISDKKAPATERVALKKAPKLDDEKDGKPPMELLKYVDPKEYEKYAQHFGVTDFRNMLVPVETDGTENSETEYVSSFSPTESDISDFSLSMSWLKCEIPLVSLARRPPSKLNCGSICQAWKFNGIARRIELSNPINTTSPLEVTFTN
jgi:hypothetical protein